MIPADEVDSTASWYRRFGELEAAGESPIYADWASGVATDATLLGLLADLPRPKRQPNLLLACSRLVGAPLLPFSGWREWVIEHWYDIRAEMLSRSTQTNEPRRCALLVPVLGLIEGPIALLEVGASAGLCLFPDRYSYRYDTGQPDGRVHLDPQHGPSTVLLECATTGRPPIPQHLPDIVWRAGIDLNPLDLTNADDALWLETLIWPEQLDRLARIRAAADIVRADPPRIVRGDATDALPALAAEAPAGVTLVVVSSAAIVYLMPDNRARFIETVRGLDARWISNEGRGIVPRAAAQLGDRTGRAAADFVLALDELPLAFSGPHGQRLDWIG